MMIHVRRTTFGTLLHSFREVAGLTQEALAERAGLSARAISDLERGVNRAPRTATLGLLAQALQLSAAERARLEAAAHQSDGFGTASVPAEEQAEHGRPPFVGRAAELALLDRHLAGEGPPVLLLAGEPGIGKSRLLQEAASRAGQAGWQVLVGGCQRRGDQEPYAPVLEALERYLQGRPPSALSADLEGCAWLVRLLPELAALPIEPLPTWRVSPEQERRLLFRAVARLLANAAGPAGSLLVLDDLQWAGSDALELLAALVRTADLPLRVVGAYRDTEVGLHDHLAISLADLANAGLARHHTLTPLTGEDAVQLLALLLADTKAAESAVRTHIVQRAGGVPFFLASCAQALRAGDGEEQSAEEVPWSIAQSIRQRLAALPTQAQTALGVAAVAGRQVPRLVLSRIIGSPDEEVVETLDTAVHSRLIVEAGREMYRFPHDLIREIVEGDLSTARRALLHRQIAEVLEATPGQPPVELLAYHYGQSGEREKATHYQEQAGDHAWAQFAHGAAVEYYGKALRHLEDLGRLLDAARVREKLAQVRETEAHYDEALTALEQASEQYSRAQDMESLGRVGAAIGWIHARRRTTAEGLARVRPLLETIEAAGGAQCLPTVYAALAYLLLGRGCHAESLAAAERAANLARVVGDDCVLVDAEIMRANAYQGFGQFKTGQKILERAVGIAEKAHSLGRLCWSLLELSSLLWTLGQFEQSVQCAARGLACAERLGDAHWIAIATCFHGNTAFLRGDWAAARGDLEHAVALGRPLGASLAALWPLHALGWFCLAEGSWQDAGWYLDEALRLAGQLADPNTIRQVQLALAERDLLEGRAAEARARLVPLLDCLEQQHANMTELLPHLAWAHLEVGETSLAQELADQAVVQARSEGRPLLLLDGLRVQAMAAIRQDDWAQAEHALEEGLTLARGLPHPYAEGRLLHVYGELHLRRSEHGPARERLEAALTIFRRLGARRASEQVEQNLGQVG